MRSLDYEDGTDLCINASRQYEEGCGCHKMHDSGLTAKETEYSVTFEEAADIVKKFVIGRLIGLMEE